MAASWTYTCIYEYIGVEMPPIGTEISTRMFDTDVHTYKSHIWHMHSTTLFEAYI